MRSQFMGALLACAAAAALAACAATNPASSASAGSAGAGVPAAAAAPPAKPLRGELAAYKPVVRDGETWYCAQEKDTGTRMMHETCLTQSQIEAKEENMRHFMQDAQGLATSSANPNAVR
jgi:hypothetical protein